MLSARRFVIALTVLVPALGISAQTKSSHDDNRDTVQATMLCLLKHPDIVQPGNEMPRYVVLRPNWGRSSRDSFSSFLKEQIEARQETLRGHRHDKHLAPEIVDAKRELGWLKPFQTRGSSSGHFHPPKVRPISSYQWDSCILLTDKGSTSYIGEDQVLDSKFGEVRVFATAQPPLYSADGSECIVMMLLPWSIHPMNLWAFLQRVHGNWLVVNYLDMHFV